MDTSENINYLFQHLKWADAVLWKRTLSTLETENDARIKKLFYHIHQVQYAFYFVWNDLPLKIPKPDSFVDLKEIAKWGFEYQMKLDEFLGSPKASDLNRIIEIPWSKFVERKLNKSIAPAMLQETMMQVIMHSTYHRGQINTRLRELGGEPPQVDFILWTWLGKPESNWSTVAL